MTQSQTPVQSQVPAQAQADGPAAEGRSLRVRLGDLGLAPENLRFDQPADEGVARLADTIAAAGLIYPLLVRPGRKGEAPYMVLDGRRRRFALLLRVERGEITLDAEVDCRLAADRASQAAAVVLSGSEQAPVHLADVIAAIGKLRKARMTPEAIGRALGYDVLEVRRLEAMASVHGAVLHAFRAGRLTLRQVKLFARLKDPERQAELARAALEGWFHDYQLKDLVGRGRMAVDDRRFRLVGVARYAEAGGRIESDLFGELPDVVADPGLVGRLWRERVEALSAGLAQRGVAVGISEERAVLPPDGLEPLPFVHVAALPEAARNAFEAARARLEAIAERLADLGDAPPADADVTEWLVGQLEAARARTLSGAIEAVTLTPADGVGLQATFHWRRPEAAPDDGEAADADGDRATAGDEPGNDGREAGQGSSGRPADEIPPAAPEPREADGATHLLHEARTDLATRGLIRSLAEDPAAALTALVAQLFKAVALRGRARSHESALTVTAVTYVGGERPVVAELDGEVRARLAARRAAYLASGQRPLAWAAGLEESERLALLAELVALSLDLREARTTEARPAARAEAREIAALCGARLTDHWTPDAGFLAVHPKGQLLRMLADMGAETPHADRLKKDELVAVVASEASERRWAPPEVQWDPLPIRPGRHQAAAAVAPAAGVAPPELADGA
jgi:ParB family chromosome partitioning protein